MTFFSQKIDIFSQKPTFFAKKTTFLLKKNEISWLKNNTKCVFLLKNVGFCMKGSYGLLNIIFEMYIFGDQIYILSAKIKKNMFFD